MSAPDLTTPALELAAALRRKDFSAVELLDACLDAVDRTNGEVNAVVWRDDEDARARARKADERLASGGDAPFLGVPIPIKDLNYVHGQPCTRGSRGAPDTPHQGPSDMVVEAFERAGFVLAGRTNTPEFGHITATENLRYGITRNPWDLERTPGGSSGGAAAAVAARMFPLPPPTHGLVPLAHPPDAGGSIRTPPACWGLVGRKPSRGRVPRRAQGWLGGVVEGAVTHTVADTAAGLAAIARPHPRPGHN